ncbi:MAG: Lrp/AsnC family transcriptional regulator [Candidatus Micrarchaeia archaeon]
MQSTLDKLNEGRKKKLVVGAVKGRYYVFDTTSTYSEEKGRKITVTLYLGKIEIDGKFIPAAHRKSFTNVENVSSLILSKSKKSPIEEIMHPDKIDSSILEILSTDGRAPISKIAEETGLSKPAVTYRIRKLEKKYGIAYTLEFGPRPFGFFRYVAFVRFVHGMPDAKEINEILEKEPMVQFAALISGKYDLFVYMLAENTQELENSLFRIRSSGVFSRTKSSWSVSYITYAYGYLPLRKEFVDLLKEKVWHRSKEAPRRKPSQILERDYLVLKELNENGRGSFADMDMKLGFNKGASDYTYYRLLNERTIYRVTINMSLPGAKYAAIIRCPQRNIGSFIAHRDEYRSYIIGDTQTPTNRYILVGDIGAPYGSLYIKPIYDERLDDVVSELKHYLKEDIIETHVITDILVGQLGYRKIAKEVTYQYKALIKNKKDESKINA